jgi:glycosyltransferase involved in cell wall biosynthesis
VSDEAVHEKPLRILHIGKYFPPHPGGMETVLRDQMNMQSRNHNIEVAAVVHSSNASLRDALEPSELGHPVWYAARWFSAIFTPVAPLFALTVYRAIKTFKPSEIRLHLPNPSCFWLLLLPSARRLPWIIHWHSDVLASPRSMGLKALYWVYWPFETWLLACADRVIATSVPYLETSKALSAVRDKCSVEMLKLDEARIPAAALSATQPPRQEGEGIRVLCVGRLTYYKDFHTAIKGVASVKGARLRVVGEGAERQSLEKTISQCGAKEHITMLGAVPDEELWAAYSWCDILCLPSVERTEAFGMVILEAALFGKPSIVANTPGSGMAWVANQCSPKGMTFSAGDHSDLARKLNHLQSLL